MGLLPWIGLFGASSLLACWVSRWGGAERLEGWKALLLVDWPYASSWSAEQIRLYVLLVWLLHAAWFAVGLFVPGARALPG